MRQAAPYAWQDWGGHSMPLIILLDSLFTKPIAFVLERVAEAVDAELDDDTRLKEELLAAQMRLELGEITAEELAEVEREVLARMRAIREERGEGEGLSLGSRIVGAEVSFGGDDGSGDGGS
ncbi:MAG TPA: gas vesicle protein GvpG [Thermoanaerobaculia bacterium]|nr:gas vesicle protein GvpG [Thermoanaerobaculia bacterium]